MYIDKLERELAQRDARIAELEKELSHLVRLIEPLERDGTMNIPGLATLNGARSALSAKETQRGE